MPTLLAVVQCKKKKKNCDSSILNLELHCNSIVKRKYIILFFFTFLSHSQRFSLTLSLKACPSHSPHSFSHLTSLFLIQGLYWSWVWFVVTAWRLAWILDFGSAWIDGDWWFSRWRLVGCQCSQWWVAQDRWCGLDVVALWVKWFHRSRFCGFIDLGFVCVLQWGIDWFLSFGFRCGSDLVVFFFFLIWVFGSSGILVGSGHGGGGGGVVMIGLFGYWEGQRLSEVEIRMKREEW